MAHGGEVVYLVRLGLLDDADQIGGIGQVAVVQLELGVVHMRILVQMIDAVGIEQGGTAFHTVHHVALLQQQLGQVGTVLSCDAGDQCDFRVTHAALLNKYSNDPVL